MKRKFTILTAVVLLMNCLGLAQTTINWTAADQGYSNQQEITSVTFDDNVSAIFDQGTNSNNAPKYFTTGSAIRCYGGNYFTITSTDDNLTNVVLTFASGEGSNAITTNVGTYSNGTWTGDAESVTFTIGGTTGHRRIAAFAITYGGDAPQPTYYTVTYNANGGTGTMTDSNSPYTAGATVTVLGNEFTRTDYEFDHWNTAADDSGTSYDEDDTFTINANTTLYAQWTENTTPTPDGVTATLNIQAYAEANNWVSGTKYATATVDPVTFTANGGGNTGKYYTSGQDWRFYQNESASITISVPEGFALVSVKPTYSVTNGGVLKNGDATIASGTTVNVSGTSVTFTVGNSGTATNGQVRFTNIDVVYVSEGGVIPPSIAANNVEIAYDATSGEINYTINNPVEGGTITATLEVDSWIQNVEVYAANNMLMFYCDQNQNGTARTATVTLSYMNGNEVLATKEVTVTQTAAPVIYSSIPALFEAATGTETSVLVTFNNWVVSGVSTNGKNVFVTDNEGHGFVIFSSSDMSNTYAAGNVLSGTAVTCTLKLYNGFAELLNVNATDLTITTGGAVTTADIAMAELAGVNTGALVHYENLTCSVDNSGSSPKYYLSDGTTTIQVYNSLFAFEALTAGTAYNITGVYQQFNNTKEVLPRSAADIEEVINAEPSITIADATSLENLDFDAHEGSLTVTFENLTEAEIENAVAYTCDANGDGISYEWIEVNMLDGAVGYVIGNNQGEARTAYFKVCTGNYCSNIVTVNQEAYEAPTYAELPFSFNDGKAAIEETDGLYQEGLGTDYSTENTKLKFDGTGDWLLLQFDERPGTLTFDIKGNGFSGSTFTVQTSEDGETFTNLKSYTDANFGNTVYSEEFTNLGENVRYIKWIYTEKVQGGGNVGLGNIALAEYTEPAHAITVDPDLVEVGAEGGEGGFEYLGNWDNAGWAEGFQFYNAEEETIDQPDWITIVYQIGENEDYHYTIAANQGEARSAYFKFWTYDDDGTTVVYSNLVTINQEGVEVPPTPGEWVMVGLNDLTEDDVFVIVGVYDEDESSFAMPNNGTSAPSAVDVTMVGNTLAGDIAENLKWNLSIGEDGYTFYPNGETESWLYCTNTNNGVRVGTNENNVFTMTPEGYLFNNATSRYIGIYNRQDWRCYTSINNNIKNQTFAFYKRVDEGSLVTYTLDIEGYGESDGGYYLIASPVSMVRPTFENGFLTDAYDLYYFDQAQEGEEWRNYEAKHFNIASGKGYLYASQENTTLTFTGVPYQGNGVIKLDYNEGAFAGWNLIGNPYNMSATIDRDFYVIHDNNDGYSELIQSSGEIAPMQGVFVIAEQEGDQVTFDNGTATGPNDQKIVLNVSNARRSVIDRALVRFGEGRQLPKFMLNPNNTKIYIAQDGEDYAVVRSINENATPVSFHAAENGTYTLSINAENVEMEYLHLLDNMTGADVDLLATPSYTFEARTTDHANRFKLVYATTTDVNENNVEPFAFFNGSEWVISNEGEATLQVIDVNGRILSSEAVNGNANVNINAANGVYMLRLVNGDNVKTQKVVVR